MKFSKAPEAPPEKSIIEKVKNDIDGLITTLRDRIDAEVFEASAAFANNSHMTQTMIM